MSARATHSLKCYCKSHNILNWSSKELLLYNNFDMFWRIIEESYEQVTNYSDFNAFSISKIVNKVWGYDTLFSRFSDCQRIFSNEFNFLLLYFNEYSASLKEIITCAHAQDRVGVSVKEPEYLLFWYHCDCGNKVRLSHRNMYGSIIGARARMEVINFYGAKK